MKKLGPAILLAMAWATCSLAAQEATNIYFSTILPPKTRLESIETNTGVILVKGKTLIGSVQGQRSTIFVRCVDFWEPISQHREMGLVVEVREADRVEDSTAVDEIDGMIAAIDYLSKTDASITALQSFEGVYKTRGELRLATFSSKQTGVVQATIQSAHQYRTGALLTMDQFARFRLLLQQGKEKLDSLRK
jgi:hypothetical protein